MAEHRMVSMRLSKDEAMEKTEPSLADKPEFPFGLQVHLDQDSLSKLGIEELPEVGSKMRLNAIVEVSGVSQHETQNDKVRRHVDLQITDMELLKNGDDKEDREASEVLFGRSELEDLKPVPAAE